MFERIYGVPTASCNNGECGNHAMAYLRYQLRGSPGRTRVMHGPVPRGYQDTAWNPVLQRGSEANCCEVRLRVARATAAQLPCFLPSAQWAMRPLC